MPQSDITALTATEAAAEIARGAISAEEYTAACLRPDRGGRTARSTLSFISIPSMRWRRPAHSIAKKPNGERIGPLHGIPVGIKDIFDTADYPTECGSPILAGRRPQADATAVRELREAGAVIIGKTVTTEFAYFHPGQDAQSARS